MDVVALNDGAKASHGDAAAARKRALKNRIASCYLLSCSIRGRREEKRVTED